MWVVAFAVGAGGPRGDASRTDQVWPETLEQPNCQNFPPNAEVEARERLKGAPPTKVVGRGALWPEGW